MKKLYILSCIICLILCLSLIREEVNTFKITGNQISLKENGQFYQGLDEIDRQIERTKTSDGVRFFLLKPLISRLTECLNADEYKVPVLLDEGSKEECWMDIFDCSYMNIRTIRFGTRQEVIHQYSRTGLGILGVTYSKSKMLGFYFSSFIVYVMLSFLPSLIIITTASLVPKYALILTAMTLVFVIISFKQACAQTKPINTMKLNISTQGRENSYNIAFLHLRQKIGLLGLIPQKGMQFGWGTQTWFKGKSLQGFLFNPLAIATSSGDKGVKAGDLRLWNILSLNVWKLKMLSMSFISYPVHGGGCDSGFSQNQLLLATNCGHIGGRSEFLWQPNKVTNSAGPVHSFKMHEKMNFLVFLNLISPYLLKVEFAASF